MANTVTLNVDFFGAFRGILSEPHLLVEVPIHGTIQDARSEIQSALERRLGSFNEALLNASAIGTDERILSNAEPVEGLSKIAVLPPVSGG